MKGLKILGITFTDADRRLMSVLGPLMFVFMAASALVNLTNGRISSALVDIGIAMLLFSALIAPPAWRIVDPEKDVQLGKLLSIVTLLGILTMATGVVYRLMMWMAPS